MNRKNVWLAVLALLLTGGSLFVRLEPRQRRLYQPWLARGAVLAALALGASAALAAGVRLRRRQVRARRQRAVDQAVAAGETWLLQRPKEARPLAVEKIHLWQRLAYAQPADEHFSFEAFGNSQAQGLALHASASKAGAVLGELFQEWPDLQRRPAGEADPALAPPGWQAAWLEVGPASAEKPIAPAAQDPLLGVLAAIAGTPAPTRVLLQVIARLDRATRGQLGRKSLNMRASASPDAGARYQNNRQARLLETRGARVFLQAVLRVAAIGPSPAEAQRAAEALAHVVCSQFGPDNPVVILARSTASQPARLAGRAIAGGAACSWADDELAALAHLPGGEALQYAPLLATGSARFLPAKPDLRLPAQARLARYTTARPG